MTEILCTNMVDLPGVYATLTIYVSLFNLSVKLGVFCILMLQLRFYQDFEYKRLRRNLSMYFIVEWISYGLCIQYFYWQRNHSHTDDNFSVVNTILYMLNVPLIFVGLSIVYLKDLKDPISEISKLDNLYIVSIF